MASYELDGVVDKESSGGGGGGSCSSALGGTETGATSADGGTVGATVDAADFNIATALLMVFINCCSCTCCFLIIQQQHAVFV